MAQAYTQSLVDPLFSPAALLPDLAPFSPVKIISRSVTRKRLRRLCTLSAMTLLGMTALSSAIVHKTAAPVVAAGPAVLPAIAVTAPAPLPAPVVQKAQAPAPIAYPLTLNLQLESGDTLISLLTDAGVSYVEAQAALDAAADLYNPKKINAGQSLSLVLDKPSGAATPVITRLSFPISLTASLEITRRAGPAPVFTAKKLEAPVEQTYARAGGEISSSLYETGIASGIPPALLDEIINAYSYDVDFQRDIKKGDAIDALFERLQTKEGVVTGHGKVIFAELRLDDRDLRIFRYVDHEGNADYYNEKGESVRKALLRTPVNGARITSSYGMRMHPLLGYSKMHRGVDFGAPIGTPIYAAGDGIVEMAGQRGGYGNYLRLRHNNRYESAYAHISHFASGIRPGMHVKQGQVIAYVGQTGLATGPHLHYEIIMNGEQVNPANVKFKTGNVLAGKELLAFRKNVKSIEAQLAALPHKNGQIAMLSAASAARDN
ncbi:MAG: M23 family metallopeptidase [Pseudomonadota bacterium]|nr:M23 family metallopeptidase [Pseudomonadota bacterium]